MRFSPARFASLATLVPALVLFVVVPGCAKQSEGERCGDVSTTNDDCADGLVCKLVNTNDVPRCCYVDDRFTDTRCEPNGNTPSGNSTADAGTDADAATDADSSTDAGDGGN
ncbi:MAG TPA: hypothetical protein VER96_24075 [Polyangiaceae bacterium]|nr:hypothetical protein [Polyangiaceae bacterium]